MKTGPWTVSALMAVWALGARAAAQCPGEWLSGVPLPATDGIVRAVTLWDADGLGPQPKRLVVGGSISMAGRVAASGVALWDGADWRALGSGVGGTAPVVYALGVYKGSLVAAGSFTTAGGLPASNIARWTGSVWKPLGAGVNGPVNALAAYAGELVAAGTFTQAGGAPASNIARWNGLTWSPLGAGTSAGPDAGAVRALTVFNGELIAAGTFSAAGGAPAGRIARWNGASWSPLGSGVGSQTYGDAPYVALLNVHNGELFAAGRFTTAGSASVKHIARWNGTAWNPLGAPGSGVNTYVPGHPYHQSHVSAMAKYQGDLIVTGAFTHAGIVPANGLARWNGSWHAFGPSILGTYPYGPRIALLFPFEGELLATRLNTQVSSIQRMDGPVWKEFRPTAALWGPEAMCSFNGDLMAGVAVPGASGQTLRTLSRWTPAGWKPRATVNADILTLSVYQGSLVAAGTFTKANGAPVGRIARWDGAAWHPLGAGISGTRVSATSVFAGALVAAGKFTGAGGISAANIAAWDGASWQPLGAGLPGLSSPTPWDGVACLAPYAGELIAGGRFVVPGDPASVNLARWNGAAWSALPPGRPVGVVYALAAHQSDLIVAGQFTLFVAGQTSPNIAKWNGATWSHMGPGLNEYVTDVGVRHGDLYAAGGFYAAGSAPVMAVGRWDGAAWSVMGSGLDAPWSPIRGTALAVHDHQLFASGHFASSGGKPALFTGRWGCVCYADCNADGQATPADTICFQALLAASHPYADCDSDGLFNAADLQCFQARLAAGCP